MQYHPSFVLNSELSVFVILEAKFCTFVRLLSQTNLVAPSLLTFCERMVISLTLIFADSVSSSNQNNNAVMPRERSDDASFTDNQDDNLMDDQDSHNVSQSSSKRSSSVLFAAIDRSPHRKKKKKKSLEHLTQIRHEEVSSANLSQLT